MERDVQRLYSTGPQGFAENIIIFKVMEEKLLERIVVTHARPMMHQPIMITRFVGATIVCCQATEIGMKLLCYSDKGFNDH
jgi:hypothetical protein